MHDLVSVIPPDAELSPHSAIDPKARGKVPGKLNSFGQWAGYPWREHPSDWAWAQQIDQMGANVGVNAGSYPAFDIDVENEELVGVIASCIEEVCGPDSLIRTSRHPRRLIAYRAADPGTIQKRVLSFDYDGERHKVEVLGEGNQWVAVGRHPSGSEYRTNQDAGGLAAVSNERVEKALEQISEVVELLGGEVTGLRGQGTTARSEVNQEDLRGDLDEVRTLVECTTNDLATREEYIAYLAAIKGALQPEKGTPAYDEALGIALDWAGRWTDGCNDPDRVRSDFDSLSPPFGLGIDFLRSGAGVNTAVHEFESIPPPPGGHEPDAFGEPSLDQSPSASRVDPVQLEDFWAYMPDHKYLFAPTRELWPAVSVDARIPPVPAGGSRGDGKSLKPSRWLDQNRAVEQMTWAPGQPEVIEGRLVSGGGWVAKPGCKVFNLYRPPEIEPGDDTQAQPWLDHIRRVFPDSAEHIIRFLAHRVQRPDEKLNHALVLLGAQGTGKDTIIQGVIHAVGPWNVKEVSPDQLMGRFNGFIKSVILRVSEARDLGDTDRYRLYDHLKTLIAAPPDVLRCDEKHLREYSVPNVCAVIITSNYTDGIYLPPDDRRHYVAISECTKGDFPESYWRDLYRWYEQEGGYKHIAAYLGNLDISDFDPKASPPKTEAFWRVVHAGRAPEDDGLSDVLDKLAWPKAVTLDELASQAEAELAHWLKDPRRARQVPHRLESVGYVAVHNPGTKDGRWKVGGKNQRVYAKRELEVSDRHLAAEALVEASR